jgi:hypothetical protein
VRVRVYPADTYGCGYFRLIWACQILQAQGAEIELVDPGARQLELRVDKEVDEQGRVIKEWTTDVVLEEDPPDVMVFQRVSHRFLTGAMPILRDKGVATVIDIDDDLARVHPSNPAYAALHPKNEYRRTQSGQPSRHSWQHLQTACRDATVVTCSTPALAQRYGAHGRVKVLWNYLPEHYYGVAHADSSLIGWPAAIASHPDDPSATGGAIARLVSEGCRFHVSGDPAGVAEAFGIFGGEVTGVAGTNIYDWPKEVNKIGVGIAPLADTRFNAAKSWLKPLEMSALGIPWVASPRAEYERLHRMGAGLTAESPRRWYRELERLVRSEELRAEIAGRGREVADRLRLTRHVDKWWSAWERAYDLQHGRVAA